MSVKAVREVEMPFPQRNLVFIGKGNTEFHQLAGVIVLLYAIETPETTSMV
jgi:hypothetical protein